MAGGSLGNQLGLHLRYPLEVKPLCPLDSHPWFCQFFHRCLRFGVFPVSSAGTSTIASPVTLRDCGFHLWLGHLVLLDFRLWLLQLFRFCSSFTLRFGFRSGDFPVGSAGTSPIARPVTLWDPPSSFGLGCPWLLALGVAFTNSPLVPLLPKVRRTFVG